MAKYINFGKFKRITTDKGDLEVLELHASEKTLAALKELGSLIKSKIDSDRPNVSLYLNEHSEEFRSQYLTNVPDNIHEVGAFSCKID